MPQHRRRIPPGMGRIMADHTVGGDKQAPWLDFYIYTASFGNINVGATGIQTIQLEADSDFNLMRLAYFAEPNGTAAPYLTTQEAELALQLTDGSNSRNLFSAPTPLPAIAGNGQLPFVLPVYRLFPQNGTINLTLTNFGAIIYNFVYVSLVGVKVFKGGKR